MKSFDGLQQSGRTGGHQLFFVAVFLLPQFINRKRYDCRTFHTFFSTHFIQLLSRPRTERQHNSDTFLHDITSHVRIAQELHKVNTKLPAICHLQAQSTKHPWGGVVVPPHVSAPKRHSQRARWSISGAHPFGAVCPPGLGCSRAHGGPLGRASCPPCGASGRRPCRPSAIAPPRPLGAALRVGAWPCGAGVSVLKVAPAYSGAEYKPGPGDLCDLVRVSGDVRSLRSL